MSDCEICGSRLDEDNFSPYCSSPDCRKAEEQAQKSDRAEAAIYQQKKQLQAKYAALKKSHTKLRIAADEGLHECERVKMHCTCNKDLGGLFARIERIEQAISDAEKIGE